MAPDAVDPLDPLDRYAVLGNPVAHSQSPFIHAAFARQTGQDLQYTRVLCAMDGFAQALRAFAESGARGCNVTVPFKFQSVALAATVTPRAALAQDEILARRDRVETRLGAGHAIAVESDQRREDD